VSQQRKETDTYIFMFAGALCLVCALILSLAATALKPTQVANARLDILKNLMGSVGVTPEELSSMTAQDVFEKYERDFEVLLLDKQDQEVDTSFMLTELLTLGYPKEDLEALDSSDLLRKFNVKKQLLANRAGRSLEEYDPGYKILFLYKPGGTLKSYVVPIEGYGLWDLIRGYVALQPDLNTVMGITFYEHKETPGLGARITEDWFKDSYIGKKILNEQGELVSIKVAKGQAAAFIPEDRLKHWVDGISGATLTGDGINQFLKQDLAFYEPYFKTIRSGT
jgi:Na+-transporting NADH:ubiquinone oxidoreductase subunit C